MEDVETRSYDSLGFSVRAQVLAFAAYVPYYGFPVWWGLLISERHYDIFDFGLLQTAKIVGLMVASVLLMIYVKRVHRGALAAITMIGIGTFYLGVMFFHDIRIIIGLQVLSGAACAAAWSLGSIYIGFTPHPERQFAIQVGLQTIAQSLFSLLLPHLYPLIGNNGIQLVYAVPLIAGAAAMIGLPARLPAKGRPAEAGASPDAASSISIWWAGVPIMIATALYYNYLINVYNYSERVGALRGLDIKTIGLVLALAMPVGLIGSIFGIAVGNRLGRVLPVAIGGVMGGVAVFFLVIPATGLVGFTIGMAAFGIMWSLVKPYIFAQTMAIDPGGRVVIVGGPLISLAGIGMASITTALATIYGLTPMLWFSCFTILLCPIFVAFSARFMRPDVVNELRQRLHRTADVFRRAHTVG